MLTALEQLPPNELVHRHERCRNLLSQRLPEAGDCSFRHGFLFIILPVRSGSAWSGCHWKENRFFLCVKVWNGPN